MFDVSIIIMGGFNEILSHQNCNVFSSSMNQFNNFVCCSKLMDLPLHGQKFTWGIVDSSSCIDHALVNSMATLKWPFMTLEALLRRLLDHNALLFTIEKHVDWAPKPFCSYDCWWDHKSFRTFITKA